MSRPSVIFGDILGVPVHYSRHPVDHYGWRGKPRRCGPVTPEFFAALEAWMRDLSEVCSWGPPELLVTGGVTGDGHGRHGEGRAIDIDSLWWPGRPPLVCRTAPDQQLGLYLAVEATLRIHFGVVLDAWYNASHEDHWHVDDGQLPGWREGSRSRAVWLQASLHYLWGQRLAVDGVAGPRTMAAVEAALAGEGMAWAIGDPARWWPAMLGEVARRGLAAVQ